MSLLLLVRTLNQNHRRLFQSTALATTLTMITSCESKDERLVEFVSRANEQQSRQNERFADQSQIVARQGEHLASAARNLVEQDATARRELLESQQTLHQQISRERTSLNEQHSQLHAEQRAARQAATRDSVVAETLTTLGLFAAALLPILVTCYAIHRLSSSRPVDELLLSTFLGDVIERGPIGLPPPSQNDPEVGSGESLLVGPGQPTTGTNEESSR